MGPIGYPETLAINYRYSLRDNLEERSSHLLLGGSLKPCILLYPVCSAGKVTVWGVEDVRIAWYFSDYGTDTSNTR
jgi:hypothetical protein